MTRDDIVRWAEEAAIMPPNWGATENQWRALHAFADLVIANNPPKRSWVGLTEEDIAEIAETLGLMDVAWVDLMQAIERRLKRRNT